MRDSKKIVFSIALIVVSSVLIVYQLVSLSVDSSLDDWANGFEGYFKSSRQQIQTGKPMALFFYTDWCPNCRKLRETILSTAEVSAYMKNFHAVKVNPEYGVLEQKLADDFKVIGYPTIVIIGAGGENVIPIHRTSNITPAQFIEQLDDARQQLAS